MVIDLESYELASLYTTALYTCGSLGLWVRVLYEYVETGVREASEPMPPSVFPTHQIRNLNAEGDTEV